MSTFREDLKSALRQFRNSPGFALATVSMLALGIGANSALFSVVNGVLLRPLPFAHGDRIVHLGYREVAPGVLPVQFSVQEIEDYRRQSRTLDRVVEYHPMSFVLLGAGEPDMVDVGVVSADFFDVLGVQALHGRSFLADDETPHSAPVLLITHDYWRSRFGGDPGIVGRTLTLNDRPITVVGVLPRLPGFPGQDDVFMLTVSCPLRTSERAVGSRNFRFLTALARLKSGVTLDQARADVAVVSGKLHQEFPQVYAKDESADVPVVPLQEELTARFRPMLRILFGILALVLLIACANVANLSLARLVGREREIAIRTALGARRGQLIRQVLIESTVLAVAGGALGLLVAAAGNGLLVDFASRYTVRASEIEIDGSVLLFTLTASLLSGLFVGAVPAFQLSRRSVSAALREGSGTASIGVRGLRFLRLFMIVQVAVSYVLLITAGLGLRGLLHLNRVDGGYDPDKVLVAGIPPLLQKYKQPEKRLQFFQALFQRLEAAPGVRSIAVASDMPLTGEPRTRSILLEGTAPGEEEIDATFHTVSDRYFQTLGIRLLKGRTFGPEDREDTLPVVIVNRSLASAQWPNEDPLGKRLAISSLGEEMRTVVGVVDDVRDYGLDTEPGPGVYVPFLQVPAGSRLFLRTASDPAGLIQAVREAVRSIDPDQPITDIQTLTQVRSEWLAPARLIATLVALFAALAFAITALGIAGTVAFAMGERRQEIAIRSALGARRSDVFGLAVWQGMAPVVVGLAAGIAGALAAARLLTSLVYGLEPRDPVTFVAVSAGLLVIAFIACSLPARHATRVDPKEILRL